MKVDFSTWLQGHSAFWMVRCHWCAREKQELIWCPYSQKKKKKKSTLFFSSFSLLNQPDLFLFPSDLSLWHQNKWILHNCHLNLMPLFSLSYLLILFIIFLSLSYDPVFLGGAALFQDLAVKITALNWVHKISKEKLPVLLY